MKNSDQGGKKKKTVQKLYTKKYCFDKRNY